MAKAGCSTRVGLEAVATGIRISGTNKDLLLSRKPGQFRACLPECQTSRAEVEIIALQSQ